MKIYRYVTARVLAWIAIAILGTLFASFKANAQSCSDEQPCTRAAAMQACEARKAQEPPYFNNNPSFPYAYQCRDTHNGSIVLERRLTDRDEPWGAFAGWSYADDVPNNCASVQPVLNAAARTDGSICSNGCVFKPDTQKDAGPIYTDSICSGSPYCAAKKWKPTGDQCGTETQKEPWDPNKPTCYSTPGSLFVSECIEPNGRHCVETQSGARMCWKSEETGPRMTKDRKEGADREKAPKQPTPPADMKDPQQQGSWSTTTINNINYYTAGYGGTGSRGGQSDTGDGGKNPGDGGDGDGDKNDDKGSVVGGTTCALLPSCSGDPLLCEEIRQTWFTRCEADNRAASEKIAADRLSKEDGTSGFNIADIFASDAPDDTELDRSGFGWGRSCPEPPEFFEQHLDNVPLCNILSIIGLIVVAIGLLHAYYILTEV